MSTTTPPIPAIPSIPSTLDTRDTFLRVLNYVVENGWSEARPDNEAKKEDFDCALANAVNEAADVLGLCYPEDHPNPAEWDGELLDWAADAGYVWSGESQDDAEDAEDADESEDA
jgi:hypothetical protein